MIYGSEYRLGRCNRHGRRMVYAWHRNTGLRLEDVRCPVCNHPLDRTSRMAYNIRGLTADEIGAARDAAIARREQKIADDGFVLAAWQHDLDNATDDVTRWRAHFAVESYTKLVDDHRAAIKRLRKAAAKAEKAAGAA